MLKWTTVSAAALCLWAAVGTASAAGPRELFLESFDTGQPDPLVGKAGKIVSVDSRGKLDVDRGTAAYFYRPGQDVAMQEWGGLTFDVQPALYGYWGMQFSLNLRRNDWGADFIDVGRYTRRLDLPSPVGRWKGGQWVHVAVVWDRDQGVKYYENGKLVASNWGKNRWAWNMDAAWLTIGNPYENASRVAQVHVYADCLTDGQVEQLSKGQPPTGDPIAPRSPAERRGDDLARMGWSADDLKEVPALTPDAPLAFTFARIVEAVDVVRTEAKPFDGFKDTAWPNPQRGVDMGSNHRTLDITLAPDQKYDRAWLFAQRTFEGRLERRPGDGGSIPLIDVHAQHPWWRGHFDKPLTDTALALYQEYGSIGGVGFYRVDPMASAPGTAPGAVPGAAPGSEAVEPLGDLAALAKMPDTQAGLDLLEETPARFWSFIAGKPDGAPAWRLDSPELGGFQFVSQPLSAQGSYDGVLVKLVIDKMEGPTPVRVQVKEPICALRDWLLADVVLTPKGEGQQTFTLLLKGRPVLNTVGMELPIMVTAANPVTWAMGKGGTSFSLCIAGDKAAARKTAIDDQVEFARDFYGEQSEGRETVWRQPGDLWPGGYYPLQWLYDYAKDDPRAAQMLYRIGTTTKHFNPVAPLAPYATPANTAGVPDWAFWQLQAIHSYDGILFWLIDHRQAPDGEFGFTWNQNCDLVENWLGAAMSWDTDDRKIKNAIHKLVDTAWNKHLVDGWTRTIRDAAHAYSDGTGPLTQQVLLAYGDPVAYERAVIAGSSLKKWTKQNADGTWAFRSTYLGAPGVWDFGSFAHESYGETQEIEPLAMVWWYNHNANAQNWITHWDLAKPDTNPVGEAFVRTLDPAKQMDFFNEQVKPFTTGRLLPPGATLGGQFVLSNTLADMGTPPAATWDAVRAAVEKKVIPSLPTGDDKIDLTPDGLYAWRETDPFWLAYLTTGDTKYLVASYKEIARWTTSFQWLHTIGQTNGDRVVMPDATIIRARMGAYPSYRSSDYNWWPNYGISYEKGAQQVAALVTENTSQKLSVRLYADTDQPHQLTARVWRLDPGEYRLTIFDYSQTPTKPATRFDDRQVTITRGSYLELKLPPKQEVKLTLTPIEGKTAPMNYDRADPAISVHGMRVDLGEHLQVNVYNLGSKPVDNLLFRVTDPHSGNVIYQTRVAHIDASTGFNVGKVIVEFQNVNEVSYGSVLVEIDPDHEIDDMNPFNNRVLFKY